MLDCREEVSSLTNKLVLMESIVNTPGEVEISEKIFSLLASLPHFQKHPEHLIKQDTIYDDLKRSNIIAMVKGIKGNSETVILLGHFDTIGVEDYSRLKEQATKPEKLTQALSGQVLPSLVKEHLSKGSHMFGRGSLDMKSGIASHLYLLHYFAEHVEQLNGNLIAVFTCDAKDGSAGILSATKKLIELKEKFQLDYVAAINADFTSPTKKGDGHRYVYKGTVGKLLPSFFITGAEAHAGSAFRSLDPNYLAAHLTQQINYNPKLSDEAHGEVTAPPVSLKQTDLKTDYNAQTAQSAIVYYNFFTHSYTPEDVLVLLKREAKIAFQRAIEELNERYKQFCHIKRKTYTPLPWRVRVLTLEELNTQLENEYGFRYIKHIQQVKQRLLQDPDIDLRKYCTKVVEEIWKWVDDKSPAIILFYSSAYLPHSSLSGSDMKEKILLEALNSAIEKVQPHYPHRISVKNFYPFISDMSFLTINETEDFTETMTHNNPGWGTKCYVHYEDIQELNVPVINIGPFGYDPHTKFERVEKEYSHFIVPNLTKFVIDKVLELHEDAADEQTIQSRLKR